MALLLAGCGKADNAPGPGGITVGEARALDEAAAMLDQRRPPPEILNATGSEAPPPQAPQAQERTPSPD